MVHPMLVSSKHHTQYAIHPGNLYTYAYLQHTCFGLLTTIRVHYCCFDNECSCSSCCRRVSCAIASLFESRIHINLQNSNLPPIHEARLSTLAVLAVLFRLPVVESELSEGIALTASASRRREERDADSSWRWVWSRIILWGDSLARNLLRGFRTRQHVDGVEVFSTLSRWVGRWEECGLTNRE